MHNMIFDGIKGLTTSMYMLADDMGLIDTESMYAHKMRHLQEKMEKITESVPLPYLGMKKPATDVVETDDEIIITMEMPGISKEDMDVSMTADEVYVSTNKPEESGDVAQCIHKNERSYDTLRRTIKLPCAVKSGDAKASLSKGILKITLPKEIIETKTKIQVEEEVCQ